MEQISTVPSSTSTLTATAKSTPTPGLPTATSTITATPVPPSIPTLVSHKNSSAYQSTQPSPDGLLQLINMINTQHVYYSRYYGYEYNSNFDFMLDELSNLLAAIDAEIKLYYPDGFPNSEIIWNYYPFTSQETYPVFPSAYLDALTKAVFDDLNRRPGSLKDQETLEGNGYTVKIHQLELDHDQESEWLVQMDWKEIAALSWLVLDQNPDGTYTRLKQSLPDMPSISPMSQVTIEAVQDFTGDGLTDLILLDSGYLAGTYSYRFRIAQGTQNGFKELSSINKGISVNLLGISDYYEIGVPSGSSWLNLTLSDPHNINWGCVWTTKTSYRWPFGREQIFVTDKEMPKTPECSLAQAVSLLAPVDNRTAIRLLENAIYHFDQNDINQHGKLLFAHYRLAILYAGLNQSLSRQHLEWVVQNSAESEQYLQEQLSLLLETERIDPIELCDVIYHGSDTELPDGWEKYVGATAAVQAYPGSTEIYPPAICPLQDIILDQLRKVNLSVQPISEKALMAQGIPVVAVQAYPFPNQKRPASFMLLGEKTQYVVGYVPTSEGWRWKVMKEFDTRNGLPQTFFQDITGDGFPELAYSQEYRTWYCPENEQGYEIFLTTYAGIGFVSLTQYVCSPVNETLDITEYLQDENGDGVVDWVADQIREFAGDSSLSAKRIKPVTWLTLDEIRSLLLADSNGVGNPANMISRLYEKKNSAGIRRRLIRERDNLNPADVWAEREWQRLTYLIGVSYEITGQADKALEIFASVLQSKNQTLWGNLAALHVMEK